VIDLDKRFTNTTLILNFASYTKLDATEIKN